MLEHPSPPLGWQDVGELFQGDLFSHLSGRVLVGLEPPHVCVLQLLDNRLQSGIWRVHHPPKLLSEHLQGDVWHTEHYGLYCPIILGLIVREPTVGGHPC